MLPSESFASPTTPSALPDVVIAQDPNGWSIAVRRHAASEQVELLIKGMDGYRRPMEFGVPIPAPDAERMIALSRDASEAAALSLNDVPTEHEHKFKVIADGWQAQADAGEELKQLYVVRDPNGWLGRVRIGEKACKLTIKGPRVGISNPEFEYGITPDFAHAVWGISPGARLMKRRHKLPAGNGLTWEIDVFLSPAIKTFLNDQPLAEIELPSPDTPFPTPFWLGEDVSTDPDYRNDSLVDRVARAGTEPSPSNKAVRRPR